MNNSAAVGTSYIIPQWLLSSTVGQSITSVIGVIVNILLLYAHIKDPCKILKCSSSPFIINVAILDLLASFACLVESVLIHFFINFSEYWPRHTSSKIFGAVLTFLHINMFSSFLSLSIVRFSSVAFPLWHRVKITARVCRFWLGALWLFHGTSEGMANFLLYFHGYVFSTHIARLAFMSLLFLITQCFYLASFISLKKQRKNLANVQDSREFNVRATRLRLKNENNFLTTIAIICSISAITLIPQLILALFIVVNGKLWKLFILWQRIIMTLSLVVNAPIYVLRMKKYRTTFKKIYCE